MDLAALAPADDPARDADAWALVFGEVGRQFQDVREGLMAVETTAPRVEAERLDGVQFLQSAFFVILLRRGLGVTLLVVLRDRVCA
jgi:hypothetical protein